MSNPTRYKMILTIYLLYKKAKRKKIKDRIVEKIGNMATGTWFRY